MIGFDMIYYGFWILRIGVAARDLILELVKNLIIVWKARWRWAWDFL